MGEAPAVTEMGGERHGDTREGLVRAVGHVLGDEQRKITEPPKAPCRAAVDESLATRGARARERPERLGGRSWALDLVETRERGCETKRLPAACGDARESRPVQLLFEEKLRVGDPLGPGDRPDARVQHTRREQAVRR